MRKHFSLPIDAKHFDRRLALFEATARDLWPAKAANCFVDSARRIAESHELGLAGARGVLPAKGESSGSPATAIRPAIADSASATEEAQQWRANS
jgi:hypothetical protein